MILTEEIENSLKNEADIDDLLKQIHDMDFSEYIHHLFKKYHLKEADIIRKSGLERTYAYKIIKELNEELEKMGYKTLAGRVSRKFFNEKFG